MIATVDNLIEATGQLIELTDEVVDGTKLGSIEVGEDLAGSEGVGGFEGEIFDIGFKAEGSGEKVDV